MVKTCNGLGVLPGGIKCPGCVECKAEGSRRKKCSSRSPTQRTLAEMRNLGRACEVVERFNPHVGKFGIRQDLFGFIDLIAIDPKLGIVGVQSCGQAFSEHVKKMTIERREVLVLWLRHAHVELWGWRKVKQKLKNGNHGKAYRWKPRVMDFWLGEEGELKWKERKIDT